MLYRYDIEDMLYKYGIRICCMCIGIEDMLYMYWYRR